MTHHFASHASNCGICGNIDGCVHDRFLRSIVYPQFDRMERRMERRITTIQWVFTLIDRMIHEGKISTEQELLQIYSMLNI